MAPHTAKAAWVCFRRDSQNGLAKPKDVDASGLALNAHRTGPHSPVKARKGHIRPNPHHRATRAFGKEIMHTQNMNNMNNMKNTQKQRRVERFWNGAIPKMSATLLAIGVGIHVGCSSACIEQKINTKDDEKVNTTTEPVLGKPTYTRKPAPTEGKGPPYPIVFVHGFSGFVKIGPVDHFYAIEEDLKKWGNDVYFPLLPAFNRPQERAIVLAEYVDDVLNKTGAKKVHIIAHSQGGIDSRYLVSSMGYSDRVASLTTISSPHRGTPLADVAENAPDNMLNPAGQFLAWLIGVGESNAPDEHAWKNAALSKAWNPSIANAIHNLSTTGMAEFNQKNPDPPNFPMFSVAGVSNVVSLEHPVCDDGVWGRPDGRDAIEPILVPTGMVLSGTDLSNPIPNDGVVPTASARWGTFLGCIPADHFDEVGHMMDQGPTPLDGFDHLQFYRNLVKNARSVEKE